MLELSGAGWALAVIAAIAVGLSKGGLAMVGIISVPLMSLVMSPVQAAGRRPLPLPTALVARWGWDQRCRAADRAAGCCESRARPPQCRRCRLRK